MSVLVGADTSPDVQVIARPGLRLRALSTGVVTDLAAARPRATRWRLTPTPRGKVTVSYLTSGWKKLRKVAGDAELFAQGGPTTLVLPRGERAAYRGALRATHGDTVNVLPLEKYLRGVVPLEIPVSWEPEALAAQAVAARTYAANGRAHPTASHYQLCDTTSCQVYGGVGAEHPVGDRRDPGVEGRGPALRRRSRRSPSSPPPTAAGPRPARRRTSSRGRTPTTRGRATRTRRGGPSLSDGTIEKAFPGIGNLTRIRFTKRTATASGAAGSSG